MDFDYAPANTTVTAALANTGTIRGAITDTGNANATISNSTGTIIGNTTLNGNGEHVFSTGGIVNGNVALSGNGLNNSFTILGGTDTGSLTLSGGNYNILNLDGGAIVGATTLNGNTNAINVGGTFTTGGTIAAATAATAVSSSGMFNVANNGVSLGALTNNGVVHVAAGDVLTVASYNAASTGIYDVGLTSTGSANTVSQLDVTTGAINLHNGAVNVTTVTPQMVATGVSSTIAMGQTGTTAVAPGAVTDNSFFYNFTVTPVNNTLVLDAQQQNIRASSDNSNNDQAVTALYGGTNANSPNTQINEVQASLKCADAGELQPRSANPAAQCRWRYGAGRGGCDGHVVRSGRPATGAIACR